MTEFVSTDCYRRFEWAVKRETRYVYNGEVQQFLAAVMETSQKRKDSIEKSSILFRAQRGYTWRMENAGTEDSCQDSLSCKHCCVSCECKSNVEHDESGKR